MKFNSNPTVFIVRNNVLTAQEHWRHGYALSACAVRSSISNLKPILVESIKCIYQSIHSWKYKPLNINILFVEETKDITKWETKKYWNKIVVGNIK